MRVAGSKLIQRTLSVMPSSAVVSALPPKLNTIEEGNTRPAHHLDDTGTKFHNPWPSFRFQSKVQWAGFFLRFNLNAPAIPSKEELRSAIPSVKPTWGGEQHNLDKLKATWLGHACYFVEFPAPPGASRGPRIIFDPVFSQRCSPSRFVGPKRLVDAPCHVKDIPEVDAILISHNHYDHADTVTLAALHEMHNPHVFMPLNNDAYLKSVGFPSTHIHCLDWWHSQLFTVTLPTQDGTITSSLEMTCTPSQHTSNRGLTDLQTALWGSWAIKQQTFVPESEGAQLYFGGDTGYRTVKYGEDENALPVNPEFAEIGRVFGGFDLALLPIGAYGPRTMWSNVHVSPRDSVRIHNDIKAKKSLAMHWGTWILTDEPFLEPLAALHTALQEEGLTDADFEVPVLGETKLYSVQVWSS